VCLVWCSAQLASFTTAPPRPTHAREHDSRRTCKLVGDSGMRSRTNTRYAWRDAMNPSEPPAYVWLTVPSFCEMEGGESSFHQITA
jgi:hypothetical protein